MKEMDQGIHADICIPFELGGRKYEAVGFLKKWEDWLAGPWVSGYEMLRRTDQDGRVVGTEEWVHLVTHLDELPNELRRYRLATKHPGRLIHGDIEYLYYEYGAWGVHWSHLEDPWGIDTLVLRRRSDAAGA